MYKFLVIAVVMCIAHRVFAEEKECGEHQEYKCETVCYKTCDNLHIMFKCVADCKKGCYCVDGYVFENKNSTKCVPKESCKTYCDREKHLYYNDEVTCECEGSDYSTCKKCTPGCACGHGHKENEDGKCVRIKNN